MNSIKNRPTEGDEIEYTIHTVFTEHSNERLNTCLKPSDEAQVTGAADVEQRLEVLEYR